jgi:hypothetical protein
VVLRKDEYDECRQPFVVKDKLVVLRVALEPRRYPVDVVFEDVAETGWYAFSTRGKPLGDVPGTIRLPKGKAALLLVKDGHRDVPLRFEVTGDPQMVVAPAPKLGRSSWSRFRHVFYLGSWTRVGLRKGGAETIMTIEEDGTFRVLTWNGRKWGGTWKMVADGIELRATGGPFVLALRDDELRSVDFEKFPWILKRR